MFFARIRLYYFLKILIALFASAQASLAANSPGQNDTEDWIWEQALAGQDADLHARCGLKLNPGDTSDIRWRAPCRSVSAAFIQRALTEPQWHNSLPLRGLH